MKGRKLYHIVLLVFWSPLLFAQQNFYATDSIREIRLYFEDPHWQATLDSLFLNEGTIGRLEASVKIDGQIYHHAGVRYKGYSSWNSGELKNPFNIELDYKIKNQNHLGFSKLKLSNVIHDPSFIREALSYEIVRTYMPAPGANFARLFVNDTLIGLYTNVEAVDLPLIKRSFPDDKGVFFKGDPETLEFPFGENANLAHSHGNDSNNYMPYYKLESDFGWSQIYRLINLLDNQPDSLSSIINIDQMLWMHALNYVMVNLDSYIGYSQNYYMYQDQHGRFNPFIWDLNMSFASFRETDGSTNFQGLTIDKAKKLDPLQHLSFSISPRPLMKKLFAEKRLKLQYLAHMRTILDEYFATGKYLNRAYELQQRIDADVQADTNKFYSYADFLKNVDTTVGGTAGMKLYPGLRDLMEARMAYLESYPGFQGAPDYQGYAVPGTTAVQGEEYWFTVKVEHADTVELAWRCNSTGLFNTTQMYDDGHHHDYVAGDHWYGASFQVTGPVIQWYFYAQNDSAAAFEPPRAARDFFATRAKLLPGQLVINEVMPGNTSLKDQDGEIEPWVELLNTTNEDLDLSGFTLQNSIGFAWETLPPMVIPAHGFATVWMDGDTNQSGLHSLGELPSENGRLYLFSNVDGVLDSISYSAIPGSRSYGRYPNGYGPFTYMIPSFAKNNFLPAAGMGQISLYPNPARDLLYVEAAGLSGDAEIRVFNHLGQEIIRETAEIQDGTLLSQLNLSGLTGGVYLLRVSTSGRDYIQKFVKQ